MGPVLAVVVQHHKVCCRLYSIEHTNISGLKSLRKEISPDVPYYILNSGPSLLSLELRRWVTG